MKASRIFVGGSDALAERLAALSSPGTEVVRSGRGQVFHGYEASSLWLLLRGTAVLDIGDAQVVLPRRRLCVVRDAALSIHLEGRAGVIGMAFPSLALDACVRGRPAFGGGRRRMLMPEAAIPAHRLLHALRQLRVGESRRSTREWEQALATQLLELACEQQRRHAALLERSPGRTHFDRCRSLRRLLLARSILQMEGGERVTIAQLAELACYSPSQFVRTFSSVFRCTPGELRQRLRLLRAKSLLATTRLSVDEVAAEVGYENRSAFARMFRAETGMSASQFRLAGGLCAPLPANLACA